MNSSKLASMPHDRVRSACYKHAYKALEYRQQGDTRMFDMHCTLLDQCAVVARRQISSGSCNLHFSNQTNKPKTTNEK